MSLIKIEDVLTSNTFGHRFIRKDQINNALEIKKVQKLVRYQLGFQDFLQYDLYTETLLFPQIPVGWLPVTEVVTIRKISSSANYVVLNCDIRLLDATMDSDRTEMFK